MKLNNSPYPIVKLPSKIQISLFLIGEELKSRKLSHLLQQLGLDECHFLPNLDSLILQTIGITEEDESFSIYNNIMEKRSRKLERHSTMKQALKAYQELINSKKKLPEKV